MEDAGINIVYGPNSVPAPVNLSPEAKKVWPNLPQLPLQAHDTKKIAALREFQAIGEKAAYDKLKTQYAIEDKEINGVMTMWSAPKEMKHKDKVMIFIHGGG